MAVYDNDRLVRDSREGCLKSCALLLEEGRRFNDAEVMREAIYCWSTEIFRRVSREESGGKPVTTAEELTEIMREFVGRLELWLSNPGEYHPDLWEMVHLYVSCVFQGHPTTLGWSYTGTNNGATKVTHFVSTLALSSGVFTVDTKGVTHPGPHFPKLNPEPEGVPIEKIGHCEVSTYWRKLREERDERNRERRG